MNAYLVVDAEDGERYVVEAEDFSSAVELWQNILVAELRREGHWSAAECRAAR